MHSGLLIYGREDYKKNQWFADQFVARAQEQGLTIDLVLTDELFLGIDEQFYAAARRKRLATPDFVINRSRNSIIATHFEKMGCRVFNSAFITEICNHKGKTHQFINSHGIKSVKTWIGNRHDFCVEQFDGDFPLILKSVAGHGGREVFFIANEKELTEKLAAFSGDEFILQEVCTNPGVDIRVFVMGNEILAAVKRYSEKSFKANFSLGGKVEPYSLSDDEKRLVKKIAQLAQFDFVGIDFILDEEGRFLFNEIEDVVGSRVLYKCYDMDVVGKYLAYIEKSQKGK
ncbi:RimK family alpha-L-glutamate ligase [Caldibacillus sp. 210928-DFI.2.22]|uniref:ATP-grasp domain-containing protein n=1 Tax=unclassified Caldibacillus TaxID=2641266 RepID=UPI001D094704|nr:MULTISPECIES: RimK family alpha-L-glutamate ligase [unclassified Caldibacillus]MCB7068856.1 RimK family alpha-L-glutamate ligase [Caldibacillus sp. 210928-DFI.2.22]MCB7072137.1 RimK family alpha-L-glutamate ligase [Caldibacillus sp. 210928-DFI.2.18]